MDSMPVCPAPMTMPMGRSLDRMVGQMGSSDGCECVPMVLMQMVMTQQMVGMRADTRGAEVFEDESVKVGKKTCTCDFSFTMAGNKVKKAAGTCDKKCSGAAKNVELGGVGMNLNVVSFAVKSINPTAKHSRGKSCRVSTSNSYSNLVVINNVSDTHRNTASW